MHKKKRIKSYIFSAAFLFIVLLFYCPAVAAEGAHSSGTEAVENITTEADHGTGHEGDRTGDLLDLLWRFINFALLVIILAVVIGKSPIKGFFAARSEEIRQKLEDLKKEKEEAERRYREVEKQLKDYESKRKDIIEDFRKEGLSEKEKIINDAKEKVKQIIEQSELTIQQEIESARNRLKQDVIDLAAEKAREILEKEIKEEDEDKLISDFIESVGKVH